MQNLDSSYRPDVRQTVIFGRSTSACVLIVLCALLAFSTSCDSSTASDDAGVAADESDSEDTSSSESVCLQRGGTCVDGAPEMDPPGYTVSCPEGSALDDGLTSVTAGGIDIINSSLALGCSRNPDGTTTPALCCLPAP